MNAEHKVNSAVGTQPHRPTIAPSGVAESPLLVDPPHRSALPHDTRLPAIPLPTEIPGLAKLFSGICFKDPATAWQRFLQVVGASPGQCDAFLTARAVGQPLALKLLSSFRLAVRAGEDPDELLAGLVTDRRDSILLNAPQQAVRETLNGVLALRGVATTLTCSLAVSRPEALGWTTRSRLGAVFIVTDDQDRLLLKLRLTETRNPEGAREWNIGVVSQDPSRPRISAADRYRHYPGEVYPHRRDFGMLSWPKLATLMAVSPQTEVSALGFAAHHYHLAKAAEALGAALDFRSPGTAEAAKRVALFDSALDGLGLEGLRARSWAVAEGRVPDPEDPEKPLEWLPPRYVWGLPGALSC